MMRLIILLFKGSTRFKLPPNRTLFHIVVQIKFQFDWHNFLMLKWILGVLKVVWQLLLLRKRARNLRKKEISN